MIRLHNLKPRPGSRHRVKRLGIGESSGHGKTSGKGHKGQKARSGGSIRLGFEGGQMPLIRRLPKRGFNNAAFKKQYALINLDDLNEFKAGTVINEEMLRESKHIRGNVAGLKGPGPWRIEAWPDDRGRSRERVGTREDRKSRRDRDLAAALLANRRQTLRRRSRKPQLQRWPKRKPRRRNPRQGKRKLLNRQKF